MTTDAQQHVRVRRLRGVLAWNEEVNRSFVPLEMHQNGGQQLLGWIASTTVGDVSVFEIDTTPVVVRRTERLLAQSPGRYYKLSQQVVGECVLEQDGRTAHLRPGDLAIYDTHREYELRYPNHTRTLVMMFPHELVDLPEDEVAHVTAKCFPGDEGIGRVITPFFTELGRNLDQLRGAHAERLIRSAIDLLVTLVSEEIRRSADLAPDPARQLVRRVRAYIEEHLGDPELGPTSIAEAHYVSTRHLHAAFSTEAMTVSAWIRARRLERIRRDLDDPVHASLPVSALAARQGLIDAPHFSRLFKAEFGVTPTDYRRGARSARTM